MNDAHVKAWNSVDADGHPIYEVDREMTMAEYVETVAGKYAAVNCRLLYPVTVSDIDRALDEMK